MGRNAKLGVASSLPLQALNALFQDSAMCEDSAIIRARCVETCESSEDFAARTQITAGIEKAAQRHVRRTA
jgi:hypothetical protein